MCQKQCANCVKASGKFVPKANVQTVQISRMHSIMDSAGKESTHNQSASSVPKLIVRKNEGLV